MRKQIIAALLASTLGVAGCLHNTKGAAPLAKTIVRVDNQSFSDFNIFVQPEAGPQLRLGLCAAKSRHDFVIPSSVLSEYPRAVRFVARPLATQVGPVSETVTVTPGDVIGLQIPPS